MWFQLLSPHRSFRFCLSSSRRRRRTRVSSLRFSPSRHVGKDARGRCSLGARAFRARAVEARRHAARAMPPPSARDPGSRPGSFAADPRDFDAPVSELLRRVEASRDAPSQQAGGGPARAGDARAARADGAGRERTRPARPRRPLHELEDPEGTFDEEFKVRDARGGGAPGGAGARPGARARADGVGWRAHPPTAFSLPRRRRPRRARAPRRRRPARGPPVRASVRARASTRAPRAPPSTRVERTTPSSRGHFFRPPKGAGRRVESPFRSVRSDDETHIFTRFFFHHLTTTLPRRRTKLVSG